MTERPTRTKGRGRWRQVGKPFYGAVALGNGTQYKIGCWVTERNELFVGVEGKGCYTFGLTHPFYVREKLGLRFEGDARNLTDFINHQIGFLAEDYKEQGDYQDQFLGEVEADDIKACYRIAMNDYIYEPIDTRFCMAYNSEFGGWILLEASGSAIIKITDCGSMGKIGLIKE